MNELISGKDAMIALANGEEVEFKCGGMSWSNLDAKQQPLEILIDKNVIFRLKPRTITINNIEVPAPFEPKEGEDCRCYYISTTFKHGFDWYHSSHHESYKAAWRTEEEIKQVVSALRSVFKDGV